MKNITTLIQALLLIKGIKRKTIYKIYNSLGNLEDTDKIIYLCKNINKSINKNIFYDYIKKAEDKIYEASLKNINTLTFLDDEFPNRLRLINDPPVLIYSKGNIKTFNKGINVAIIGTRNPTKHGEGITKRLSKNFTKESCNIISGLANGCDQIAHLSCLEEKGNTLAVLPSGIDNIYPKSNIELADKIVASDGILISEYPIEHKPYKAEYIERDRLQSALSEIVVIVETNIKGGTMHTANFALLQNKILACYKHPEKYDNNEKALGNKKLISEKKALSISNKEDINRLIEKAKKLETELNKQNIIKFKKIEQMKLPTLGGDYGSNF